MYGREDKIAAERTFRTVLAEFSEEPLPQMSSRQATVDELFMSLTLRLLFKLFIVELLAYR